MKKIFLLFLFTIFIFLGNVSAQSYSPQECSVENKNFMKHSINNFIDKDSIERDVNYFIIRNKYDKKIIKEKIESISNYLENLENLPLSLRLNEKEKDGLYYQSQTLYKELQKVCNINIKPLSCGSLNEKPLLSQPEKGSEGLCVNGVNDWIATDDPGYYWSCVGKDQKKVYCNAPMLKEQENNEVTFNIGQINNNYKEVVIGYWYGGKEVLFNYGFNENDYSYSFTDIGDDIELGDNYKYKIIPGKKYYYSFQDRANGEILYKGSFTGKNSDGSIGLFYNAWCVKGKIVSNKGKSIKQPGNRCGYGKDKNGNYRTKLDGENYFTKYGTYTCISKKENYGNEMCPKEEINLSQTGSSNEVTFNIGQIKNNYKDVIIGYYYGGKEVVFNYGFNENDYSYSFTDLGDDIELGDNYKYKIIPGKKYYYSFQDRDNGEILYKGSFLTKNSDGSTGSFYNAWCNKGKILSNKGKAVKQWFNGCGGGGKTYKHGDKFRNYTCVSKSINYGNESCPKVFNNPTIGLPEGFGKKSNFKISYDSKTAEEYCKFKGYNKYVTGKSLEVNSIDNNYIISNNFKSYYKYIDEVGFRIIKKKDFKVFEKIECEEPITELLPLPGICSRKMLCSQGIYHWYKADTKDEYRWTCIGLNGGESNSCNYKKTVVSKRIENFNIEDINGGIRIKYNYDYGNILLKYGYDNDHIFEKIDNTGTIEIKNDELISGRRYNYYFYDFLTKNYIWKNGSFIAK